MFQVSPFLAWGDFHERSRFAYSTIHEEKWGTTRSLTAPSTLSSTNVLITASQWSRQHRLYAWLVGITRRQGDDISGRGYYTHYMCLCGLNRSCVYPCYGNLVPPHLQSQGKAPWGRGWRYGCNCDINDYVLRENRDLLTNKAELPVIQLRFGYTG